MMARQQVWLGFVALAAACRLDADGLGTSAPAVPVVDDVAVEEDRSSPLPVLLPPAMKSDAEPAVECTEPSAISVEGHCYFDPGSTYDWFAARDECLTRGAHLVTITDAAELARVQPLVTDEHWIGLRKVGDAGVFSWITGESFALDAFAPGEPNGTGSCAKTLPSGEWRDHSCLEPLPAICERD